MPRSGVTLEAEKAVLEARIVEVRRLIREEWATMSLQEAQVRGKEIVKAQQRIDRIDNQTKRRKR
jgi:hypothetical protein